MIHINEETNEIRMTRGDTLRAQVAVERDDEPYTPVAGDSVAFYLKHPDMTSRRREYTDPEPLITKSVPIGTMILQLDPASRTNSSTAAGKSRQSIRIAFSCFFCGS